MIPQEKSAAVTQALREAFGVSQCEDIRVIKDLASSSVFRIVVQGTQFVLKISTRTNDPARHYTCMRAAAEAGLAPRVWYSSLEDRISIEDFVEARPLPAAEAVIRVSAALRKLHALPPFPGAPNSINTSCTFLINNGPAVDGFIQRVQAANILPKAESKELFARHEQLAAVHPRDGSDMASSHNDLFKPDNILFDGRKVWLVDWEAAFLNDRYADLAVVANLFLTSDAEEKSFLREYFGKPPDEYQVARFFLMQQVAHMFYAMGFLWLGSSGKPIDWNEAAPEYEEFHRQFRAGEVDLADSRTKIAYGKVHWERLFDDIRQARFEEALRIVSDGRRAP